MAPLHSIIYFACVALNDGDDDEGMQRKQKEPKGKTGGRKENVGK
jgi:hypothetical protein